MPTRPARPCRKMGCRGTTRERHGYCEQHQHLASGWNQPGRATAAERGYGHRWRALRAMVLRRDRHVCQLCLAAGRATPATEVDHRVPKSQGGTDDPANLQAICSECHAAKTEVERRAAACPAHRKI